MMDIKQLAEQGEVTDDELMMLAAYYSSLLRNTDLAVAKKAAEAFKLFVKHHPGLYGRLRRLLFDEVEAAKAEGRISRFKHDSDILLRFGI